MQTLIIQPGQLTLADFRRVAFESDLKLALDPASFPAIDAAAETVKQVVAEGRVCYGINTGFGLLASERISIDDLETLQRSLVLSHAAGIGEPLNEAAVRLVLALKINSLARGYSGVRRLVIDMLIGFFNAGIYPVIPAKGSVGASGDLAPLAHLAVVLIGEGEAIVNGQRLPAREALATGSAGAGAELTPIVLAPKEGLALLNGTQVSTALALLGLFATEDLFATAIVTGSLSVDAALGSRRPFDARIHAVRGHVGQSDTARAFRELLGESEIGRSHAHCNKVQDPYSLRCQPQVMGACLTQMRHAAGVLELEGNAVSDNPLIFASGRGASADNEVLSGGNFHGEPVAFAADNLALALAEIGALSERRIAMLVDRNLSSGLPAFLVEHGGLNSGFMIAQVTAAALASENKSLAHPASVDSIPTSANQEDHVSMATFAARRLSDMAENTAGIVAIEWLAACQGLDFRAPLKTSPRLEETHAFLRARVVFYERDRYFAKDIAEATALVRSGICHRFMPPDLLPSGRSK